MRKRYKGKIDMRFNFTSIYLNGRDQIRLRYHFVQKLRNIRLGDKLCLLYVVDLMSILGRILFVGEILSPWKINCNETRVLFSRLASNTNQ